MPVWTFALNPPWGNLRSHKKSYSVKGLRKRPHSGVSKKVHLLIHSFFNKYLLRTHFVPGTVVGTEDPMENKTDKVPDFQKLMVGPTVEHM